MRAAGLGFSHVFQLDADGQHDTSGIPRFLELSSRSPDAVICGFPEYGEDAPRSRVKGRGFANMWMHIATLSNSVKDAMVGFRIYPVKPVEDILDGTPWIDRGMGFDIELLLPSTKSSDDGKRLCGLSVRLFFAKGDGRTHGIFPTSGTIFSNHHWKIKAIRGAVAA